MIGMSSLKVTVEPLVVLPHPDADRLELAQVGLYRAVVAKGAYRTGEYALYIPEQSVLPPGLIEELGLTGKLAGGAKDRVKAVRLRGELSQGIVCRPAALVGIDWAAASAQGTDHADTLGIVKWVPPIPPQMASEAISGVDLLRWVDIENLQRYPDVFADGEPVVITEKLHGSCLLATYVRTDDQLLVSSKGMAASGMALQEADRNLYWRAVHRHRLGEVLRRLAGEFAAERVGLYGEVYGSGVQDLHYGADARADGTLGFAAFDLRVDTGGEPRWLDASDARDVLARHGVPTVPVLYEGPFDLATVRSLADGPTVLGGAHIREGVVVRPARERWSDVLGGRAIVKLVSPAYLIRGGDATEYE